METPSLEDLRERQQSIAEQLVELNKEFELLNLTIHKLESEDGTN